MSSIGLKNNFGSTIHTDQFAAERPRRAEFSSTFDLRHFALCSLVIAALSAYDTFLVYYYRVTILILEQNPICHFLIRCDHKTLNYFLIGKIVGTTSAILIMYLVYIWNRRIGIPVVIAITVFQVLLIAYQYVS